MPAFLNIAAIGATSFASDALGPLDSVAHPLEPGQYRGEAFQGDVRIGAFNLVVGDDGSGEQIEVDLCEVVKGAGELGPFRGGRAKGQPLFAVFHCDHGREGLRVVLRRASARDVIFDSQALQAGDYYIVTPVRPGTWTMRSGKSGKGQLVVMPAKPGKQPRASAMGMMIKADGESFRPANIKIPAGDGIAFEITGKDVAIRLELADKRGSFAKGRKKVGLRIPGPPLEPKPKASGLTRAA